jgi:hypothetical protein
MTNYLIDAKDGDKFVAKNGLILIYCTEGKNLAYAPYQFCLKSEETGNTYFYSNEGEYYEGKDPEMNLVGSECEISTNNGTITQVDQELETGWETALRVFSWLVFAGCFIAFFILLGNSYTVGIAFGVLAYGIIQLFPIMVFANISVSLKEANELKKKILKEIKQSNKQKEETK